jgi:hypothetical protein
MPPSPSVEVSDQVVDDTSVRGKVAPKKNGKRTRGRTVYLHDDLFERILVAAHRRDRTISEYVAGILERQVPDHRVRVETAGDVRPESATVAD